MIIRSAVVLFYIYHVFATNTTAYPKVSSSLPITSVSPVATERLLLLAGNQSSISGSASSNKHSNSSHHFPSNITANSTSFVRKPTATRLPLPGQTVQPGPPNFPPPGLGHNPNQLSSKRPNIAQIFFEVIGGVAGTVVLLALLRCIYVYRKTPTNRTSPEVSEVDRRMALLRTLPWRPPPVPPPPPPYQPAPEYTAAIDTRNEGWDAQPPDRTRDPTPAEHGLVSQV